MNPLHFPAFIWERLTWWSQWLTDPAHAGRADVIGAGTTGLVVALAVIAYVQRDRLKPIFAWIKLHPVATTVVVTPVAALLLLCLSKFATFIGATLTTVGLLIALDNNRRSHDREEKRFKRQGIAARAAMVLELASVSNYCVVVAKELRKATYPDAFRIILDGKFTAPPMSAAATFKEMIVSTDNSKVAKRCAQILTYIQRVESSLRTIRMSQREDFEEDQHICFFNMARLRAVSDSLFEHSRIGIPDIKKIEWLAIDHAVKAFDLDKDKPFLEFLAPIKKQFPDDPMNVLVVSIRMDVKPLVIK